MRLCLNCGSEISNSIRQCPHCNSHELERPVGRSKAVTVNIKDGLPTVDEAMRKLKKEIETQRRRGTAVLRVIHGYGSTGVGGKIGEETQKELSALRNGRHIKDFIPGTEYSKASPKCKELLRKYPELNKGYKTDAGNKGSTLVVL